MNNLKKMKEKRNSLLAKMKQLTEKAGEEVRALTEEENAEFDSLENEVRELDATIEKMERELKPLDMAPEPDTTENRDAEEVEKRDIESFAEYIRNGAAGIENRAESNLTMTDNGAVVPYTIANMIIKQVVDMCPIYAMASKFPVKGTLSIPYYDESEGTIEVAYAEEFVDLTSTSAKFANIELTGYLVGSLSKLSRSLINNSDFNLVSFVVNDMAQKISLFIEKALLFGDTKQDGLKGITKGVKLASTTPTADELIELQDSIKDVFQSKCVWIMSPATRTAIRKLKDGENRYMLNPDITSAFGYMLLGKPVYVTDAITDETIFYGDFSGLAVKEIERPSVQILREHFALQHAIGVNAWFEMDSKVYDAQRMAKASTSFETLKAKAATRVTTKTTKDE